MPEMPAMPAGSINSWHLYHRTGHRINIQEIREDQYVWFVWTGDRSTMIGRSVDGQTYTRYRTAFRGAKRFIDDL